MTQYYQSLTGEKLILKHNNKSSHTARVIKNCLFGRKKTHLFNIFFKGDLARTRTPAADVMAPTEH